MRLYYSSLIFTILGADFFNFRNLTVKIPFLNDAETLPASIPSGKIIDRENFPKNIPA